MTLPLVRFSTTSCAVAGSPKSSGFSGFSSSDELVQLIKNDSEAERIIFLSIDFFRVLSGYKYRSKHSWNY